MTGRSPSEQIDEWVLAYLDGTLQAKPFVQFTEAMRNDPAALERFVELASLDRSLLDTLTQGEQVQAMQQAHHQHADPALSFEAMLALLRRGSESAQLVHLQPETRPSRPRVPYVVGSALAAVLVLAVSLTFIFHDGPTIPPPPAAFSPNPVTAASETVATLTDSHAARWAGADRSAGAPLQAGQRLILLEGFAEIATKRGAVVVLEAPASVELIDSPNAIRLHSGKLVGICETESSKSFVVRTPHMDVTDLGTRFGVDATQANATEVHIFEGSVEVSRPAHGLGGTERVLLTRGHAVRASAADERLIDIEEDPARFTSITPRKFELPGTGQGLALGEVDPNWQVVAADGKRLTRVEFLKVGASPNGHLQAPANDSATSQWLRGDHIMVQRVGKKAVFTCRASFELPAGVDPSDAALVLRFDADEGVERIRLNGRERETPANSWGDEHTGFNTTRLVGGLQAGANTIELDVIDLVRRNSTQWSLHVRWHIETGLGSST